MRNNLFCQYKSKNDLKYFLRVQNVNNKQKLNRNIDGLLMNLCLMPFSFRLEMWCFILSIRKANDRKKD